jgi:hypothetical protein
VDTSAVDKHISNRKDIAMQDLVDKFVYAAGRDNVAELRRLVAAGVDKNGNSSHVGVCTVSVSVC